MPRIIPPEDFTTKLFQSVPASQRPDFETVFTGLLSGTTPKDIKARLSEGSKTPTQYLKDIYQLLRTEHGIKSPLDIYDTLITNGARVEITLSELMNFHRMGAASHGLLRQACEGPVSVKDNKLAAAFFESQYFPEGMHKNVMSLILLERVSRHASKQLQERGIQFVFNVSAGNHGLRINPEPQPPTENSALYI